MTTTPTDVATLQRALERARRDGVTTSREVRRRYAPTLSRRRYARALVELTGGRQ